MKMVGVNRYQFGSAIWVGLGIRVTRLLEKKKRVLHDVVVVSVVVVPLRSPTSSNSCHAVACVLQ